MLIFFLEIQKPKRTENLFKNKKDLDKAKFTKKIKIIHGELDQSTQNEKYDEALFVIDLGFNKDIGAIKQKLLHDSNNNPIVFNTLGFLLV